MNIKTVMLLCGAAGLSALAPSAASAQSSFSISIGSGPGYSGYANPYGYQGNGYGNNGYSTYGRHEAQHDQIEEEHGDGHDQLDEEHDQAHGQGVNPWEHAQLHQQLQYQHGYNDYQLKRQHRSEHQREQWRRRYSNYGYYRY